MANATNAKVAIAVMDKAEIIAVAGEGEGEGEGELADGTPMT